MRLSFVSDIHGNIDALAAVARRRGATVVLGDLLDYVDYHDPSGGILGRVFGERHVRQFTALRSAGDFHGLREFNRSLWDQHAGPARHADRRRLGALPRGAGGGRSGRAAHARKR